MATTNEKEEIQLDKPLILASRFWRTFANPWDSWTGTPSSKPFELFKFVVTDEDNSGIPSEKELDKTLPVEKPNLDEFKTSPENGIRTMWIGHATVLVQFDGLTVLTDPIFSERCGPPLISPTRYRPTPCRIGELPDIDAVVISHNHYDHLDKNSVRELQMKYGPKLKWYVPLGLKKWLKDVGCEKVEELNWWGEDDYNDKFKFVCLPCQHWSKRGALDTNWTLWCSWAVLGPKHRFYFGGDTGYCPVFKTIGQKYGKFSLAAIPIGAYEPRKFMKTQHINPEEAVQIHQDIKAERSLGIHWGTFKLTYEPYLEPREKILQIVKEKNLKEGAFFTLNHGQIKVIQSLDDATQPANTETETSVK
ncbi:N-acyl-phosphatidylethanolamine-hydrolyzing phospholipase D-like [Gigantopelta aegis]|uniref:N-acyl-phosphatidylethanolamine-hydrolyzing phospholipase D-like n=1 Tax=Gigantopelta aegis TaxID=1735272 RepID=UPI001B888CC3|nr:N-acyl-phosphatidylethanolamine-hydrolyzing phospholipase D-like [Gigantopelta aegis]XP_041349064.1 N-acyl-phosphatidylethanolamine-hydrolyzing phospholipase D-like [Gigantopelta aegis]XP_041349065.1 N-acyl-phosphatidylethanolamine-hydrolyzing phospholipase D-like [Gigantopelta aegis]XP_041349066.1 N-acyl-phosphatidylethanolamine-hydrolyzing phospholipase D-like [Gigantopelta aegis]